MSEQAEDHGESHGRRWLRLNAPEGFRWTDEDVLDEKVDGFFNGVMTGLALMWVIWIVLAVVL